MAGPIRALTQGLRHSLTMEGTATRSEFWWLVLHHWIAACVALASVVKLGEVAAPYGPEDAAVAGAFLGFGWVTLAAFMATFRRLSDAGFSRGWIALWFFPPLVGSMALAVICMLPSARPPSADARARTAEAPSPGLAPRTGPSAEDLRALRHARMSRA
ncbi:DUF805 domain-containing protein [Jannaschia sp. Os4]|uniref:DUF805 domain-containing protein n=1 Tax=Jannaschia sp. Os4 TaxID=2807617 RepID=UPI00193A05E8|nr:DUF805 domain-containing protein [Jannaschia sp. Os4]MBM2577712.1 DUF805 domain-containing protein [Jannaschia sp. Os4]